MNLKFIFAEEICETVKRVNKVVLLIFGFQARFLGIMGVFFFFPAIVPYGTKKNC